MSLGETVTLSGCRYIALPARRGASAPWVLTRRGQSAACRRNSVSPISANAIGNLRYVMVETTMRDEDAAVAEHSGHATPQQLARGVARLQRPAELLVTHIEPHKREAVHAQVRAALGGRAVHFVERGEVYRL